jgi:hypothetical protein
VEAKTNFRIKFQLHLLRLRLVNEAGGGGKNHEVRALPLLQRQRREGRGGKAKRTQVDTSFYAHNFSYIAVSGIQGRPMTTTTKEEEGNASKYSLHVEAVHGVGSGAGGGGGLA